MATVTSEPAGQEPFTELSTRRIGPVRRFFPQRLRAMDAVVKCPVRSRCRPW